VPPDGKKFLPASSTGNVVVEKETRPVGVVEANGVNASVQEAHLGKLFERAGPMNAKLGLRHGTASWDPDILDNDECPPVLSQDDWDSNPRAFTLEIEKRSDGGYRRSETSLGCVGVGAVPCCVGGSLSGSKTAVWDNSFRDLPGEMDLISYHPMWSRQCGIVDRVMEVQRKCVPMMTADIFTKGLTGAEFEAIARTIVGRDEGCPA
jgi:hypothetical protein